VADHHLLVFFEIDWLSGVEPEKSGPDQGKCLAPNQSDGGSRSERRAAGDGSAFQGHRLYRLGCSRDFFIREGSLALRIAVHDLRTDRIGSMEVLLAEVPLSRRRDGAGKS
jgi:hypothetical protein